jgi:hypothetical protein
MRIYERLCSVVTYAQPTGTSETILLILMYTGKKTGRQQPSSGLKTAFFMFPNLRRRQAKQAVECTLGAEERAFQELTEVRLWRRSDRPSSIKKWCDGS